MSSGHFLKIRGQAKRSVPTLRRTGVEGGHGAYVPLPTLQFHRCSGPPPPRSGTMIQIKMGARQTAQEIRAVSSVIWSMSPMKRCLAAFAVTASQFAPVAQANDGLEAKMRAYVPVVSLVKLCDLRINDATSADHRAMLAAVKSDPNANKLAYRLQYETQTAYIKARDGGQRVAFCKDFIAANSQFAKARFTAEVENQMRDVS